MYNIFAGTEFKKDLKLALKRNYDISHMDMVITTLAEGKALPPKYGGHRLKGEYEGCRECRIAPERLLIYEIDEDKHTLYLIRTGTYNDLRSRKGALQMFEKRKKPSARGGYHPKRTSGWGMIAGTGMALVLGMLLLYANTKVVDYVTNNIQYFNPVIQTEIRLMVKYNIPPMGTEWIEIWADYFPNRFTEDG